ncbi:MAG: dihydroorotate dehydrogenase electron transfer subunit [Tindallia sp. MSAO_Bac2]|nr:MAG: dihydroorotate dehydrogenase electron transfer subunit [Tindallia sp. MSAO_Bac2]
MSMLKKAQIIEHEKKGPGIYRMDFFSPEISQKALPGQFIHLKVREEGYHPLLRRPFSIYDVDKDRGQVSILYRVVGLGTHIMAQILPGALMEIMGPLGRPFTLSKEAERVLLVAGGMGFAPLHFLIKELVKGNQVVEVITGARTGEELMGEDDLGRSGVKYSVATQDGSRGFQGRVTGLLEKKLDEGNYDFLYSCGPYPMLEKVVSLASTLGLKGEVSLEEVMACGVGACLGCAAPTRGDKGNLDYKKVCQEGPVFSLEEVFFDG